MNRNKIQYFVGMLILAFAFSSMVTWGQDRIVAQDNSIELRSAYLRLETDVNIPAKEEGVIKEVLCKIGEEVSPGTLMALIDDQTAILLARKAELEFQIANAEANSGAAVQLCEEELKVAEAKVKRGRDSDRKFDISLSDTELEQLELDYTTKKIQLEKAQMDQKNAGKKELLSSNALELAKALVERHRIRSLTEGIVLEIMREPGEWVKPGEPVFRVVGLKTLKVIGFVDSKFASQNLVGRTVIVTSAKEGRATVKRRGKLTFVSPEFDSVNRMVKVIATVPNEDKQLNPGEKVQVKVLSAGQ